MTERDESILAIKLLQDDIPNLNQAIADREYLGLDASDLIARRNAKLWKIEGLKALLKKEDEVDGWIKERIVEFHNQIGNGLSMLEDALDDAEFEQKTGLDTAVEINNIHRAVDKLVQTVCPEIRGIDDYDTPRETDDEGKFQIAVESVRRMLQVAKETIHRGIEITSCKQYRVDLYDAIYNLDEALKSVNNIEKQSCEAAE